MCNGTINNKLNSVPKGVYLPISKLHLFLAEADLPSHNS